jgi:hypothetical protein
MAKPAMVIPAIKINAARGDKLQYGHKVIARLRSESDVTGSGWCEFSICIKLMIE